MMVGVALGCFGEIRKLEFPTVRFPFTLSRDIGWLHLEPKNGGEVFPWFGWLAMLLVGLFALWWIHRFSRPQLFSPITERRIERFKHIRRGYVSLIIIFVLAGIAALDHVVVGSEALAVKYEGKWTFPAFTRSIEKFKDYGVEGDDAGHPGELPRAEARVEGGEARASGHHADPAVCPDQ